MNNDKVLEKPLLRYNDNLLRTCNFFAFLDSLHQFPGCGFLQSGLTQSRHSMQAPKSIRFRLRRPSVPQMVQQLLTNTPFDGFPRELINLILQQLFVEDIFKLLRVSWGTKTLLENEVYWNPILHCLFAPERIAHHLNTAAQNIPNFSLSANPSRLLVANMINRSYRDAYIREAYDHAMRLLDYQGSPQQKKPFTPSAFEAIQGTIGKFIRWASFRPLAEFPRLVNENFPSVLILRHTPCPFRERVIFHFEECNSRYALLHEFVYVIALVERRYHSTTKFDGPYIYFVLDILRVFLNQETDFLRLVGPFETPDFIPFTCSYRQCEHLLCHERRILLAEREQQLLLRYQNQK